jgi:hypothetical protein
MAKTPIGTDLTLTSPCLIDFQTLGFPDMLFRPYADVGNTCPTMPLDYALADKDGTVLTHFVLNRFAPGPNSDFFWQFLPEDPEKFVPYNYFWIWPAPGNRKTLIVRFNNQEPHLVAIQSGFDSIRNDIHIEDGILVIRARAAGPLKVP